jgi:Flp pilus assembly CpaF family ATPase
MLNIGVSTGGNMTVKLEDLSRVVAPLERYLNDPSIWEILIDNHRRVLVERSGRLEEVESPFESPEACAP